MARHKEGWRLVCRRGIYGIRWRQEDPSRPRPEVSLGTRDPVEAARLAPQAYADIINGTVKRTVEKTLVSPKTPLDELIAKWVAAIKTELGEDTDKTYIIYGKHWLKQMKTIGDVSSDKIGDYQRARLEVVLRGTVALELSAMRRFFRWLKERKYIASVPEFPALGPKVLGKNYAIRRRRKPTHVLSPEQIELLLAKLPPWSERKSKGKHFPIRARFRFAYETGLRPFTLGRIEWRDVTEFGLHIRPECDKNRWERVVPLSPGAKAALDSIRNGGERDVYVFGKHDLGGHFEAAAEAALGADLADRLTPYDLKHGRVTEWFDSGASELGIQFLTGTTTAIRVYAHPTRRSAEEVIGGHSGDTANGGRRREQKTRQNTANSDRGTTKRKRRNGGNS